MTRPELDVTFGFLLHDIARLMRKRFDQRARGLGLTRSQWQVLAHLARHEGINQVGLADIIEVEPITLGRLIDRMEEAGWVERRPHPTDRRARLLYLTAKARPVFDRMRALGDGVRAEALAGLCEAERDRLMATLIAIRGNLRDRSAPGSAGEGVAETSEALEQAAR
ncbi:MAG: MarR family transcriptional regulator [Alphaproteobacteria bacterium]|nr:MarR family transcriptional regulator [Alphaproteobacteria bacterium]